MDAPISLAPPTMIFSPEIVAIGYYTVENVESWLDVEKFMRWLGNRAQKSSGVPSTEQLTQPVSSSRLRPSASQLRPSSSPAQEVPSSPLPPPPSRSMSRYHPSKSSSHPRSLSPISLDSDTDLPLPINLLPSAAAKRGTHAEPEKLGSESDSDCVLFCVPELRDISELPATSWTVPPKNEGEDYAYRLNLEDDSREWLDPKNQPLSMAAIIKSQLLVTYLKNTSSLPPVINKDVVGARDVLGVYLEVVD
ncbi:hypothetical protein B0H12DRAFT_1073342 [Mycena haematopus]|nr:hypothetical protein B0H12DRAFT_1073342 [Mycena haematopus]